MTKKRASSGGQLTPYKTYVLLAVASQFCITIIEFLCKAALIPWSMLPWLFGFFLCFGSLAAGFITVGSLRKKIGQAFLCFLISLIVLTVTYLVFYLIGSSIEKL
jgi:hypothetical protein